MDAPFLILETGEPVAPLKRHGGFAHWVRSAARLPADAVLVCRPADGEPLPEAVGFAGVFITGSAAMVTDRADWSEACAAWLAAAHGAGLPLFGICYGHQLLAHALGGEVGYNPLGREMGTVAVELLPEAADDPLFGGLPSPFPAHATHQQSVLVAPPGAVRLARSEGDGMQALRMGATTWGVQFHPEFGTRAMAGYIVARAAALREEGSNPAAMLAAVRPTPAARSLLRAFVRLARTRQAP